MSREEMSISLEEGLDRIVERDGQKILSDTEFLRQEMVEFHVNQSDAAKFMLLTTIPGYTQLANGNVPGGQADLNRFAYNAMALSGLNRSEVLRLVAILAQLSGVAVPYTWQSATYDPQNDTFSGEENNRSDGSAFGPFVIPAGVYENDMQVIRSAFAKITSERKNSSDSSASGKFPREAIEKLDRLCSAGIPEALYYKGVLTLKAQDPDDFASDEGARLLEQAAQQGESRAAVCLGDWWFHQYELGHASARTAYEYYTQEGGEALGARQQQAVVACLNEQTFNQRVCRGGFLLLILEFLFVLLSPLSGIYLPLRIPGILLCAAGALALVLAYRRLKSDPFTDVRWAPVLVMCGSFLYLVLRAFRRI